MSASTAVMPAPSTGVPRCPSTLLTKPECHCRACLLELISTHGTAVPAVKAPASAGGIL